MESSLILLLTFVLIIGSLMLGAMIGWVANDVFGIYLHAQQPQIQLHPELYDDDGMMIRQELYSVRFDVDEEICEEDDD